MRLDDLGAAFCDDGILEVRGSAPVQGRTSIVDFLGGAVAAPNATASQSNVKRIVRHNVANIRFSELTPEQAHVVCYFTVFTEIGLDHYGRYRDVFVPVGSTDGPWLIRHRFVSTDWAAPNSTMAR